MNPNPIDLWFQRNGWEPFPFQREAWAAYREGASGLVHAPTGMGKTLSVWLGPVLEWIEEHPSQACWPCTPDPLRVLWITPLRALAADTADSLRRPVEESNIPWSVGIRTGDTSSSERACQRERLPTALVTTPESLSLLLAHPDANARFSALRCVVIDEWHELLSTKRGVQTELCLARLRRLRPKLRVWGLSATLANLQQAAEVLHGTSTARLRIVQGVHDKEIVIETLIPEEIERLPWGGHLGLKLLPRVLEALESRRTTLLFTNTRSQAELWFNAIQEARGGDDPLIALHHGSLDRELRDAAERGLKDGSLRAVVCTSSLDLGVDFSTVEQVIQVGSPKGIARLLQRAGRSGHRPGEPSRILCVPTNAFELVEFSAARVAADARRVEAREPIEGPLDVLVQHLVSMALAGGFFEEEMRTEVMESHAYRHLSNGAWRWCLDFIERGGSALRAYPQFARVMPGKDGRWRVTSEAIARSHRLSIGTIVSDMAVTLKYQNGARLGTVEETFLSRLKPGEKFLFGGKVLELVRFRGNEARVRAARGKTGAVPRWMGGRMPLSTLLADGVRQRLEDAREGHYPDPEMAAARPVLELQRQLSLIPEATDLLIETAKTREGYHAFVYTMEGRLVHEGLAALLAWRIARERPRTITTVINDYGMELLSAKPMEFSETEWRGFLSPDRLLEDLLECMNATQMAKMQFREVARVAGLIQQGLPGREKSQRQLLISSNLLFDVLGQFDPENLLLEQARREVLERQLEVRRLQRALTAAQQRTLRLVALERLSPLSFPLWVERIREHVSTERWIDRVEAMIRQLEAKENGPTSS